MHMHTCMYIYIYIYTHTHKYKYCICAYMITYVFSDNHMCKYILCIYMYIYIYFIYIRIWMSIHIFLFIYILYTCIKSFTVDGYDMDINTVKIQALRRSSSSWRHSSSVGHGLRYSMWFRVLNLGGITNNSYMLGIVRVLSLDIVTILTFFNLC